MFNFKFRFFSTNGKTGFSYDLGICPLMKKINGKFKALCGMTKCYSAALLNGQRKTLTNKLEDMESRFELVDNELEVLNALAKVIPNFLLRGFSFGDYLPQYKEVFLKILRGYKGRHIIISKNLWIDGDIDLIKEVADKTTLSLGFTKQLYPKWKKWFAANKSIKFSTAYSYENIEDLEWLKKTDPEMFEAVDVFHDSAIHLRVPKLDAKAKTPKHAKILEGYHRNHETHLALIEKIDKSALYRQCNIYGDPKVKRGCIDCKGCEVMRRFAA